MVLLEICCDSVKGAACAQAAHAHRIELCSCLVEGGITPSYGLIQEARRVLTSTKLMVLIRPRGGDFVYTNDEVQVMLGDIHTAKQLGADGVVLGCLTTNGSVDTRLAGVLIQAAKQQAMDITFHRAFDMTNDLSAALETLVQLGVPRVLTSGGQPSAAEGAAVICNLVHQAAGRISIMAGGGVRSSNCQTLLAETGVAELHTSAKMHFPSPMLFRPSHISMCSAPSDWDRHTTSEDEILLILSSIAGSPTPAT